jgi:LacI family transcriptional regulator
LRVGFNVAASLSDVAKRAGTSITTVSRVLSGSSHPVASETRKRVVAAVEEFGFRPNALARALAKQMTQTIGVVIGDITDPYFAEIARGVEDTAGPLGYLTIVCNADRNPVTELAYFRMLQDHFAAGMLFAGGAFPNLPEANALNEAVACAAASGARIVCLADRGVGGVPVLAVDERAALYDLTKHVIRLGHRKIAFVEGPEGLSTSILRQAGFQQAMEEADLDPSVRFPGGFGIESGRTAATAMLARALPEAIIAATDETAVGVLLTLRRAGIQVPQEVSVAGVDDSRYSQIMDLTTVRLPTYELGTLAVRHILNPADALLKGYTYLSHRIVQRGTTSRRLRTAGAKKSCSAGTPGA